MTDYAGEIRSNLPRATSSWDDEVMISPAQEAILRAANLRTLDTPSQQNVEAAERKHEEAVRAAIPQRWQGQERWQGRENEERRLVRIMHPHGIFYRLRRAGVDARIEPNQFFARLWLNTDAKVGRIGVNAWVRDEQTGAPSVRIVTTLQYPYGPEWSLFHFDAVGVATAERYRGWRTAMLQLIVAGVLTEAEVDRAFGPVPLDDASLYYRQQLQQYRNRRAGLTL